MNGVAEEPLFEVRQPKLLTNRAVFVVYAQGLLLVIPVLCSILLVTVLTLSAATVLVPVAVLLLATFFLPVGFGNSQVRKLVARLGPPPSPASTIMQLTLRPRIHSGPRAELEDADDIGYLTFTDSALEFKGDSVTLLVPLKRVKSVVKRNIGRGLFVYGARICLQVSDLPGITWIEFAERSSRFLPESHRLSRQIYEQLASRLSLSRDRS